MTKSAFLFIAIPLLASLAALHAADANLPSWDMAMLSQTPATTESQEGKVAGLQSFFVTALAYKGRPTKFYAYVGFPTNVSGKVPAVVLVHGGGGTAFANWVKYWNAKGYAALAMDNEGQIPVRVTGAKPHWKTIDSLNLPWAGGPQRTDLPFADCQQPLQDQWMYHAVADSLLSVSLLASYPEVDTNRIGIVGISWGSVVCSIVGGIDQRLAFVIPQYIGGNLKLGNVWYAYMKNHPETFRWDPANFYTNATNRAHWLWINDMHDTYGLPPMTTKSRQETCPNSWMTILPTLHHGEIWGETGPNAVREIYAFADSTTRDTPALANILRTTLGKGKVTLTWKAENPISSAEIYYTTNPIPLITVAGESREDWKNVKYGMQKIALPPVTTLSDGTKQASFALPVDMKAGIINLTDERGLSVSCDFLTFQ